MANNIIAKAYLIGGNVINIYDVADYEIIKERWEARMRGTIYCYSRYYLPNTGVYLNDEFVTCLEECRR